MRKCAFERVVKIYRPYRQTIECTPRSILMETEHAYFPLLTTLIAVKISRASIALLEKSKILCSGRTNVLSQRHDVTTTVGCLLIASSEANFHVVVKAFHSAPGANVLSRFSHCSSTSFGNMIPIYALSGHSPSGVESFLPSPPNMSMRGGDSGAERSFFVIRLVNILFPLPFHPINTSSGNHLLDYT